MKWVTRENANVHRIACPWLIKKFIDARGGDALAVGFWPRSSQEAPCRSQM